MWREDGGPTFFGLPEPVHVLDTAPTLLAMAPSNGKVIDVVVRRAHGFGIVRVPITKPK
ncbi:MAG TPA: hypothetical protein VGF94_03670 [Kofleriaceae bacterium]